MTPAHSSEVWNAELKGTRPFSEQGGRIPCHQWVHVCVAPLQQSAPDTPGLPAWQTQVRPPPTHGGSITLSIPMILSLQDINAYNGDQPVEKLPFPIIADKNRELAVKLGMLDPDERDKDGMPLTARVVSLWL